MSGYQFDDNAKPIFSRGPLLVLKLALVGALSAGLMFLGVNESRSLDPLRDGIALALTPVLWISDMPRQLNDLSDHVRSRESLLAENSTLQHEHLRLNARLQRLATLEEENRRMRAMLASSKDIHNAVMLAEIQSTSLDPYQQRIRINRGKVDGVFDGQALIDAHGIMGQVIEVTPYSSTAVLITDESQGVPVEVNRNGLRTVAHGSGSMQLDLPFLPANSDIQKGDLLVSSGLGGKYPPGYPVAYVDSIEHQPGEHFLKIKATPAARILHGREILLVRKDAATPTTAQLIDPAAEPGRVASAD